MTTPNYPQQPGPYGPPPGGQPYGPPPGQQPPPYTPPGGYPADPYAQPQQPGPYGPPPHGPAPMGQPGPYGPPPMGGGPMPYPAAPPPKSGGTAAKIIGGIFVLALIAGGVLIVAGILGAGGGPSSAKAGDCAKISGTKNNPDYKSVDCSSPDANFIVGASKSSSSACPNDNYVTYTVSGRRSTRTKLCLIEKLEEGKCYQPDAVNDSMTNAVACSTKGSTSRPVFKIEKVVKSTTADCGEGKELSFPDPSPGLTYCYTLPE